MSERKYEITAEHRAAILCLWGDAIDRAALVQALGGITQRRTGQALETVQAWLRETYED